MSELDSIALIIASIVDQIDDHTEFRCSIADDDHKGSPMFAVYAGDMWVTNFVINPDTDVVAILVSAGGAKWQSLTLSDPAMYDKLIANFRWWKMRRLGRYHA